MKKYTLISSNCVATFVYKLLGKAYTNPFTWSSMSAVDFIDLAKNYSSINFSNIKTCKTGDIAYSKQIDINDTTRNNTLSILLDDKYGILYIHHERSDINIKKISDRYMRFNPEAYRPFFILNSNISTTEEKCREFLNLKIDDSLVISIFDIDHPRHIRKVDNFIPQDELAEHIVIPYLQKNILNSDTSHD